MTVNPNKSRRLKLGQFRLLVVSGGEFKLDGGTMFGVVPKALWSRRVAADADNNLQQAANCILIDTGQSKFLVDTGYGSRLTDKQRQIYGAQAGNPLLESLAEHELDVDSIDTVVFSHLHFDHVGGAFVSGRKPDHCEPAFPRARHIVQRAEWEVAQADLPELQGVYAPQDLQALQDNGNLELIEGTAQLAPGIQAIFTGGHSPGHQVLRLESDGEVAYYMGDLCPTCHHLSIRWGTSYDLDVLTVRQRKAELLERVADERAWLLFDHDPEVPFSRIRTDSRRDYVVD